MVVFSDNDHDDHGDGHFGDSDNDDDNYDEDLESKNSDQSGGYMSRELILEAVSASVSR